VTLDERGPQALASGVPRAAGARRYDVRRVLLDAMRSSVTIGVAAGAALSMVLSGSADAGRTVAVTRGTFDDGPVLLGKRIAWSELGCVTGCDSEEPDAGTDAWTLRVAAPGQRPVILARRRLSFAGEGTTSSSGVSMSFGASPTQLVLVRMSQSSDEFFGDSAGVSVGVGPLGGRLRRLLSCTTDEGADVPHPLFPFDLYGDLLAYDSRPCDARAERPVVRNLATRTAVGLPLTPGREIARFAVAGRYVALATAPPASGGWPDSVAVHDARSGEVVYTAALPAGEVLHGMDLRSDGSLAVVSSSSFNDPPSVFCATSSLLLFAPTQSSGRRLEARPCSGLAALAGSRIVYRAGAGKRSALTTVTPEGVRQRLLGIGNVRLHGLDAGRSRIAYAIRMCSGGARLVVQRPGGAAASAGSARCPVSLPAGRLPASRSGWVAVPVRCPRGCDGYLDVSRGPLYAVSDKRFRLLSGRRYVRVRLGETARRRLRARGTLRVRLSVALYDRAFDYHVVSRGALLLQR
jgi:hypothetical protein